MSYFPKNYHPDFVTQEEIHKLSVEKGWWESWPDPLKRLPESLMLIVSEAAETLEEYRNGHGPTEIYYEFPEANQFYRATIGPEPTRLIKGAFPDDNYIQRGKPAGIPIELADIVIRIRDTAQSLGIDLEAAIAEKHEYNKSRPYQHGRKRA
jgi:hypothetical protein